MGFSQKSNTRYAFFCAHFLIFIVISCELSINAFSIAVVPAGEETELLVGVHNEGTFTSP